METIYIIEDEPLLAEHLQQHLLNKGYEVIGTAATAEAAIIAIENSQPSLVFIDIILAGEMDGIEAGQIIHERFDIPIIFLTAHKDKHFFERAKLIPPCAYLLKPFNESELELTIEMAIFRYQMKKRMQAAMKVAEEASMAKSEFISHLNHELRTPLQAILGFGELLQLSDQSLFTPQQREYIKEVITAGKYMETLINEVLNLSSIEHKTSTANMEIISLDEVIPNCLNLIKPQINACTVEVTNQMAGGHGHLVQADKTRLMEVLINLLTNAIKYNRPQGHVIIDCSSAPGEPLRLTVTDTGIGINETDRARLFQPFVRFVSVNSNIKGTGLGLVINKRLMQMMGGDIGYDNNPDGGSCFWIELQQAPPV